MLSRKQLDVIPAVDVLEGRVVRLSGGRREAVTLEGGDPVELAQRFASEGATRLHLVDLDAAFGRGDNRALLAEVVKRLDVAVELSGGIRDDASLDAALATGAARVNLGTAALESPDWVRSAIARHGSQTPHGSIVAPPCPSGPTQFSALAISRAVLVLPPPRTPVIRNACASRSRAIALASVVTIASCPISSENVCGRYLRASTR